MMKQKTASQQCNQTSFETVFHTPPAFIESARKVMGWIDLDPATDAVANSTIKASTFFTEEDDGLMQHWEGNVWMNHPWGAKENKCQKGCKKKTCKRRKWHRKKDFLGNNAWINKLITHYRNFDVPQAMCITYASTSEGWFKPLKNEFPMCLLDGRTSFYDIHGNELPQNIKGCAITYLGPNVLAFAREFNQYGTVVCPVSSGFLMRRDERVVA